MNFFELQSRAKQKTGILVSYFILAVIFIIALINVLLFLAFNMNSTNMEQALNHYQPISVYVSLGVIAFIGVGSLVAFFRLRGGGEAVAEMVGARRVNPDTDNINEKRLINVVEEMSIASGTPVPELYVLDSEPGINAFVAGLRPTETVLVVTRGAMETFSRDEMQGVVGHEYSHIFNGDMRINIRLLAVLAGILMIAQFGRVLMRSGGRSRSKNSGQAALIGLGLFIIGYVGIFFGNLIKASISRQREFLADASSVQFTRNPDGIAGALWKIKQHSEGSLLNNTHSDDISHFCFGEAVTHQFSTLLATHPPLDDRIKAVDPGFLARARARELSQRSQERIKQDAEQQSEPASTGPGLAALAGAGLSPAIIGGLVGTVNNQHLDYAQRLHHGLPPELLKAVHGQDTAECVIYALVLSAMKPEIQTRSMQNLETIAGHSVYHTTAKLLAQITECDRTYRLPLINLALPTLKGLPDKRKQNLLSCLENLIKTDNRFTIFEFSLFTIIKDHIGKDAGMNPGEKYFKYDDIINEINLIISLLIRVGGANEDEAVKLHDRIIHLFTQSGIKIVDKNKCSLTEVNDALAKLNLLSPILKKTVIEACADCVLHDGKILPAESELLQAIAASLDCPMPPLMA